MNLVPPILHFVDAKAISDIPLSLSPSFVSDQHTNQIELPRTDHHTNGVPFVLVQLQSVSVHEAAASE